jgi:hypothetical protein
MRRIQIPSLLQDLLQGHEPNRLVETVVSSFSDWLARNETVFFRDYTDHGISHIESVLETACGLLTKDAKAHFSPHDAACLICATILHDSALIAVIACVDLNNRGVEPETCNLNIISDGLWRSCHACLNSREPSG